MENEIISLILQTAFNEDNNINNAVCAITECCTVFNNIISSENNCPRRTQNFFEKVAPLYSPDEFKIYFRLNRSHFEVC